MQGWLVTDKALTDQINRDSEAMQRRCRRVIDAHGLKAEFGDGRGAAAELYWAAVADGCVACPDHAVCLGGVAPPFPIHGFWTDGAAAAVDEVLACEPATACLGGVESTCALGYAKARCAACARGYYRLAHYCSVCAEGYIVEKVLLFQLVMYACAIALFVRQYDQLVHVGAFSIVLRYVQTTYLMVFFEVVH